MITQCLAHSTRCDYSCYTVITVPITILRLNTIYIYYTRLNESIYLIKLKITFTRLKGGRADPLTSPLVVSLSKIYIYNFSILITGRWLVFSISWYQNRTIRQIQFNHDSPLLLRIKVLCNIDIRSNVLKGEQFG